ncbi:hypothetical protein QO004_003742 [Rhizobium mesoamericanum]|uniref:hypothetical protein n=1 Tax=Rhizobium mesoamericanum TaxID=1079800 RepID=UPI0027847C54|nr:hypothetical protein [Rhizobium mesoamericanum]MDQ0561941.1 hypothetical protein [Rhizobium mesoamericanum]
MFGSKLRRLAAIWRGQDIKEALDELSLRLARIESLSIAIETRRDFSDTQLSMLHDQLGRNFMPNSDAASHKVLMAHWQNERHRTVTYADLLASGFRVFSQNDEDGIILRIFSHIGTTNQYVIEIGSNCSGSDIGIPENLSTNLIINHGWHGAIFEIDQKECDRMRYFFARNLATKHFHLVRGGQNTYFSPMIVNDEVTPENVEALLRSASDEPEPDLMIVDIDGGDYEVVRCMTSRPRVLVVEFEKRFRDRHCTVQFDRRNFSKSFAQSGSTSLPAWEKLLGEKGYILCAIGTCGFNAFFVRADVANERFAMLTATAAFDNHPILSKAPDEIWMSPDETWERV